jgi:hypothetical protein
MQSPAMLAHAKAFFPDFRPGSAPDGDATLAAALRGETATASPDYWCYLLLDFARADRELEDLPLLRALAVGALCGWQERLEKIAAVELGFTKRQLTRMQKEAPELLRKAEQP